MKKEGQFLSEERPFSLDEIYGLSKGKFYRYYVNDEIYVEGQVISNDGVTTIIKVTDRYGEGFFEILYYKEVRKFFPSFRDEDAESLTEYLCLDIETECNLFFRDPDSDDIMLQVFDENNERSLIPAEPFKFRMDRLKKVLIFELKKREDAEKERLANLSDPLITVEVSEATIDDMYDNFDKEKGIEKQKLEYSLNRSVHWLNNRNCAILSAWRGSYNRTENNKRNQELQQAYLIGTNDNFGKDKVEYVGILRINNLDAKQYSEIGSGRISFEKNSQTQWNELFAYSSHTLGCF